MVEEKFDDSDTGADVANIDGAADINCITNIDVANVKASQFTLLKGYPLSNALVTDSETAVCSFSL